MADILVMTVIAGQRQPQSIAVILLLQYLVPAVLTAWR